jgi:hypothetical protein
MREQARIIQPTVSVLSAVTFMQSGPNGLPLLHHTLLIVGPLAIRPLRESTRH